MCHPLGSYMASAAAVIRCKRISVKSDPPPSPPRLIWCPQDEEISAMASSLHSFHCRITQTFWNCCPMQKFEVLQCRFTGRSDQNTLRFIFTIFAFTGKYYWLASRELEQCTDGCLSCIKNYLMLSSGVCAGEGLIQNSPVKSNQWKMALTVSQQQRRRETNPLEPFTWKHSFKDFRLDLTSKKSLQMIIQCFV